MDTTLILTVVLGYLVAVGLVAELFFRTALRRSARDTYKIHGFGNAGLAFPMVVAIYIVHAFTLFPIQLPFYLVGWVIRRIAGVLVRAEQARALRVYDASQHTVVPTPFECVTVGQEALARLIEASSEGILAPGGTASEAIATSILEAFDVTYKLATTEGALPDDDFRDEEDFDDER